MSLPFSKEKLGVSDSKTPSAQAPGRGNTKTKAKNLNVAYAIWFAAFALGFLCPNNLGDTTASLVFGSSGTRSLRTSQQEDHPRDEGSRSSKDRVDQIALKSMQEPPVPLQPKISIKDEPKTTVAVFYHIDEDVTSSGIAGQVRETIRRVGQTAGATSSDTNWVLHYDISRDVQQSITVHTVDAFCQDFKQQLTCYHSEQDVSSIARSSQKYGKHIFGLERMHAFCQEDSRLSDVVVYIHNGQANEILDASLKPECIRSVLRQKSAIDNERPSCDTCGRHFDPTLGYQGNIFSSSCSYVQQLLAVRDHATELEGSLGVESSESRPPAHELWIGSHPNARPCHVSGVQGNLKGSQQVVRVAHSPTPLDAVQI